MKMPATLADLGIAGLVRVRLRATGRAGRVAAAAIVLLHPAVIDVSAWWGQYESIYLLFALAAVVFALNGRNGLAAAALAVCADDQAAGAAVPRPVRRVVLGARRVREVRSRPRAIGAGGHRRPVAAVHPRRRPRELPAATSADYQGDIFAILSLRRLEPLVARPVALAGGDFVSDQDAILGPITLRHVGLCPDRAVRGSSSPSLIAARPDGRGRSSWVCRVDADRVLLPDHDARALRVRRARLPDAAGPGPARPRADDRLRGRLHREPAGGGPADAEIGAFLPIDGSLGIAGSVAILALTVAMMRLTGVGQAPRSEAPDPAPGPAPAMP